MHTPEYVARVHSGELTQKVNLDFIHEMGAHGASHVQLAECLFGHLGQMLSCLAACCSSCCLHALREGGSACMRSEKAAVVYGHLGSRAVCL